MKVILIDDVERLGKTGDVVAVKDGYARNFLIPKEKAKEATPQNMKMLEALKKKKDEDEKKSIEEFKALADRISSISLTLSAKVGEEEKLYGSVTADAISKALGEEGIVIDKKDIILDEPIKKLGIYQVAVKVHPEVKANLRIWVVKG